MRKLGIGILILGLMGALGWAYFTLTRPPGARVTLEIVKPDKVLVGQPFTLGVSYGNDGERPVEEARIALVLPADLVFADEEAGVRVKDVRLGEIPPGGLGQEEFSVIAMGSEQSVKRVEARLRYQTEGSSGEYEVKETADITIGESLASITITSPEKVYSGQDFDLVIKYQNNSNQNLANLRLTLDLPGTYKVRRAEPAFSGGTNAWAIASLPPGGTGSVTLSGSLAAPEQSLTSITAKLVSGQGSTQYIAGSQAATIGIATPPLSVFVDLSNGSSYATRPGDTLNYILRFKNNSAVTMKDLVLRATWEGALLDPATVNGEGALDTLKNTITWTTATTPALASLDPGEQGSVQFSIHAKNSYPIVRPGDKNFTVKMNAQIESPTVPQGTSALKTMSVASLETKVAGRLDFAAQGFFRDPASGFVNSGPFPPRVNVPTRYTMHWVLKNYSTDMKNVRISGYLPPNVKFTGRFKSTTTAKPAYNGTTGEVSWAVGDLAAGQGISTAAPEAIFQVEATPAVNQVGEVMQLMGESKLTATDAYTGQVVNLSATAIFTELRDDATVANIQKTVQP